MKILGLFEQRTEFPQSLNVFLGKNWRIRFGENFEQRDFERRERQ